MTEVVLNQITQGQNIRQEPPRGGNQRCQYEKVLVYKYPNFMGTEGLLRANKWLVDLERTFYISGCTEEQKTSKQQKALDFVNLTQGSMTVDQYAARFMELGRFAPHLIGTEKMQAKKCQDGLQPRIRNQVACLRIENFQELVNLASITEAEQRRLIAQAQADRKRGLPYSSRGSMEKRKNTPGGVVMPNGKVKTPVKAKIYDITPGEVDLEADEMADARVITGNISNFALTDS
ncbi:hypothetical protein F2P56_035689 [Juglans regia]|uniref:Retrotransposon gag domain-containing protein n=2 Tax=Juglans regia TaxID=51240 RepID=A0A833SJU9_JUGRE|nr:uncharacterized protein LOC108985583 [Juglans regia]KAF5443101.1 hypothetical protein F2P56_035689 [Juglans regia]